MKIVIIGAGSKTFGLGQIADLLSADALQERGVQLTLVDTDEDALSTMARLAGRIKEHTGSDMTVAPTTDRREALRGADYVIVSVARKRYELWEQDFRVPLAHGFRHCYGENGGPGALFHALRSLELVIPICRDIEQLCPEALLLNFTNPEARVLHAIGHLTQVRAVGICHGVFYALTVVERYLGQPRDDFEIVSAGINHCYCLVRARERATGRDVLPELVRRAAEDGRPDRQVFRTLAEVFGVFSFPSDTHVGEYVPFASEFTGLKWRLGQESRRVGAPRDGGLDLTEYAEGRRPVDEHIMRPSGEITVPIITDIELNTGSYRPAVNVINQEGYIENLPRDAAVEVPAVVDGRGVHPMPVGALPEPFAAILRTQCAIISLVTEAYRTRDRKLLLQALLLDPHVNSVSEAAKLIDEMLELQQDYLPSFD